MSKTDSEVILDADQASAELCRRPGGLAFFVKEFWDEIVPNPLVWNWHMDVLCDEIQASDERVFKRLPKLYDIIINVPPGTSKTLIVSVLSTAWEFARMPEGRFFVGSYSDGAVASISDYIRLVMKSEKYKRWFPDVEIRKDRDSLHNFKTTANGEYYAFTIGGTITSKHADILKVDDPLNPKQAASEAELKTANDFFDQTLPSRKVDKDVTPTYLVMQRLNQNDPTGHLLERDPGGIHHICLPGTVSKLVKPEKYRALYDENGLLDNKRLSVSALGKLQIELGSYGYAGQIDQSPAPPGGEIWKSEWFKVIPDDQMPLMKWGTGEGTDWDLAYTDDEKNAASAYITSFKYKELIYIDRLDWAWKEFPDLIKWMKMQIAPHYIEAKASGKSAKQTLSGEGIIAIEVEVQGGADKVARARSATPTVEAGMVCVRKSIAERLFNDSKQGIAFFPKGQFKDLADALAQCIQRHKSGGVKVHDDTDEVDELSELDY